MKKFVYISLLFLLLLLSGNEAFAQRRRANPRAAVQIENIALDDPLELPDSLQLARLDSIRIAKDSIARADSLFKADSVAMLEKSSLDRPVFSAAGDSIIEVFTGGKRLIYYYGGVTVDYDDMKLSADYMEYDMATGTVFARGTLDTITGEWKGRPEMTQGGSSYQMEELKYNFNTKKSFISNMVTNEEEGILNGAKINMLADESINIVKARYTVCDAEEPHYYLALKDAKIITKPRRKVVFGTAHPVVEGVDMPIFLPYGFVPDRPEKSSGILFPNFGEETARGFFAKDGGVYFVFGDHFDMALTGSVYTLGSWSLSANANYNFRYKNSGNFGITYSKDKEGEVPDVRESTNFMMRWSHQQDSKAHPGSTFSASVNFSTPGNKRYNATSVSNAMENATSSSVSYSHNWSAQVLNSTANFNVSIAATHSQNTRDTTNSNYTFGLPNINFSMSTIYPFKRKQRVGKEKYWEGISFGYSANFRNSSSFTSQDFRAGGVDTVVAKMQNGLTHNFSIGLPSHQLFKYINMSPGISYGMNWFFKENGVEFNPKTNRMETVQGRAFSGFGVTNTASGSISFSTQIYGLMNFGKHRKVQAIRHVIKPSLSMSYSPDWGTYANGYRSISYMDTLGVMRDYKYNVYSGQSGSVPSQGRSGSASFSIDNNLEAKVRDFKDTTGTGVKKIKLIDQLSLSGSYNFLADSCRLSPIGIRMSTSLLDGKVHVQASTTFDPYGVNEHGSRCAQSYLSQFGKLLRLTNANASLSYGISGKGHINGNDGSSLAGGKGSGSGSGGQGYYRAYYHPVTGEYLPGGWLYYTNPDAPWSINFSYNFSYSKSYNTSTGKAVPQNRFTQALSFNGSLKITPKMNLTFTSGLDLMTMKLTMTQLNFTYDLHCFNISVQVVPFGGYQSYQFRIAANASALADLLKFEKGNSYLDRY